MNKSIELLNIVNNGQYITETNYFELASAETGYVYVSWNAGACRLLVPDIAVERGYIEEIKTGDSALIVYGKFREGADMAIFTAEFDELVASGKAYSIEGHKNGVHGLVGYGLDIIFDDGTNNPFSFITHMALVDRLLPLTDAGSNVDVLVYTKAGLVHSTKGKYIVADIIPFIEGA